MPYTRVDFSLLLLTKFLNGQHMPWDPRHTAPLHSGAERHLSRASYPLQFPAQSGASWTRVIRNCFEYPGETHASVQSPLHEKGFLMFQWNFLYFSLWLQSPVLSLGINGNNLALAMSLPCLGFLEANLTSKGRGEGGFKYLSLVCPRSAPGPLSPCSCFCCWYGCRSPSCSPLHPLLDSTAGGLWLS